MRFGFCVHAFDKCLSDANELIILASSAPPSARDAALRGGLLLAVGAFDFLVHEIIRVELFDRTGKKDKKINLDVPFSVFMAGDNKISDEIDLHIRKRNSYKSFVGSGNIKDCFNTISVDIWKEFQKSTGRDHCAVKKKLDDIWRWRNRIAHEGDLVPSNLTFSHWPIYEDDVSESLVFLRRLGIDLVETVRSIS